MSDGTTLRLQEVFRTVLELPQGTDVQSLRQSDEPRWDSVAHVWLVTGLESEFNVRIEIADSLRITSFEAARQVLTELGVS